jgi:hypothetical protein
MPRRVAARLDPDAGSLARANDVRRGADAVSLKAGRRLQAKNSRLCVFGRIPSVRSADSATDKRSVCARAMLSPLMGTRIGFNIDGTRAIPLQ